MTLKEQHSNSVVVIKVGDKYKKVGLGKNSGCVVANKSEMKMVEKTYPLLFETKKNNTNDLQLQDTDTKNGENSGRAN